VTLEGRHILVTAGPTHEPIDPVRVIANRSSGKQGFAIASAAAEAGARVTLIAGPVCRDTPAGVTRVDVETALEMQAALAAALPGDCAILVAAVADWRVVPAPNKLKKSLGPPRLKFEANPDILAELARSPHRPPLLIGFAAETDNVVDNARAKLAAKGCDWILANDVSPGTGIMGGSENAVTLITAEGEESWERMGKDAVAARIADRIARALA
jgi:phosphopantothenoylcysteine decarboxylase/phosphopantothenate--cysteine ligase